MTTTTNPTHSEAAAMEGQATPKRDGLKSASIVLSIIGLLIAGYITIAHLTNTATVCPANATFDCDTVQSSIYSHIGPIPIQYLGVAGYTVILIVLLLESRIPFLTSKGKILVFGMTLFGFLYSAYLTSIEAFRLYKWCLWCLGSAITMTVLCVISFVRVWRSIRADAELDEEGEAAI